ncbi:MAG: hypothetical protein H6733_14035 [Alphaproteobacteria bacterium]|nr:hypothetical protein [Alphaproteobacteria bacterium]
MASSHERRAQAKADKHKKKRAVAQQARKERTRRTHAGIGTAASWPVRDAWLSDSWHEPEARIQAVIARGHADGTWAWAAFEVDTADAGLVACAHQVGVSEGHVQQALVERSENEAMVSVEPAAVARLVHDAVAWSRTHKHRDPDGFADAYALLGDLDPDDSPYDFTFGDARDEDTEEIPRLGLIGRIGKLFGR